MTAGGRDLEPELVAWGFVVPHLRAIVVIEPSYRVDAPPSLHLAVSLPVVTAPPEPVLRANGWAPRGWLRRSWGLLARVDLEHTPDGAA